MGAGIIKFLLALWLIINFIFGLFVFVHLLEKVDDEDVRVYDIILSIIFLPVVIAGLLIALINYIFVYIFNFIFNREIIKNFLNKKVWR